MGRGGGERGGGRVSECFHKESESKNIVYVFFFFVFFFFVCFLFFFCQGGGGEGKGMARVSECLTMDPNKKKCFWRGGKWREEGARVNEFLLLRIQIFLKKEIFGWGG